MNILHINTNYEVSTIYPNMFRAINKLNNVSGRMYYPVSSEKVVKDKSVDVSKCLNKFDRFFYFSRNSKLFRDITELYDVNNYDMTLAYSLFSNGFLSYSLKKRYDIPYIVIVQNTDLNMYFKRMIHLRGIGRKIIKEAHKVIFISEPYKELLLNKYTRAIDKEQVEKKSIVIPFGIDNFWFNNLNQKKNINHKNHIRLLYVGKIDRNKNLLTTLKVCDELIKLGFQVSYTIVGNIEVTNIGKLIKKKGYVTYVPFLKKNDLLKVYRENDIFIMPSIRESFGLVYAEAMSQGLPIIYTRGQGFDKHFNEGEIGYSVDCFNVKEITEKVINIYNNYATLSNNCINLVNKFEWRNISRHYRSIFPDRQ